MIRPGSLGVSFSPTNDERTQDAVGSPLQKAIQILSLRVPRFAGTRQPIPQSILAGSPTARMGGGSPMSAVVESVLRSLTGGQVPAGAAGQVQAGAAGPISGVGAPGMGAPGVGAPTVTPGIRERGNYPPVVPGTPQPPTFTPGIGQKTSVEPPLPRYPGSVPRVPQSGNAIPGPQGPATLPQIDRRFVPQPTQQPIPIGSGTFPPRPGEWRPDPTGPRPTPVPGDSNELLNLIFGGRSAF